MKTYYINLTGTNVVPQPTEPTAVVSQPPAPKDTNVKSQADYDALVKELAAEKAKNESLLSGGTTSGKVNIGEITNNGSVIVDC